MSRNNRVIRNTSLPDPPRLASAELSALPWLIGSDWFPINEAFERIRGVDKLCFLLLVPVVV